MGAFPLIVMRTLLLSSIAGLTAFSFHGPEAVAESPDEPCTMNHFEGHLAVTIELKEILDALAEKEASLS